ncbi:MAG: thiamine pyrophosphate-dependent dehydrogenase E1 component subunit alpha [Gammaproteobacteria bacterium]
MNLNREEAVDIFQRMLLMRRFEEMVIQLSMEEEHSFGHFHVYIGQEATGAPILAQLGGEDLITTTHRNHGHIIGRGAEPGRALAEILGRADGFNDGRGGTLHLCVRPAGFLSTSAVVGGSVGLGTGAAYALKNGNSNALAVSFFGDGALEEGIVFESLNMARLYNLPLLLVCENNSGGAAGVAAGEYPASEMSAQRLVDIPLSLGIQSEVVDGADADAVHKTVSEAIACIRAGSGPVFIEALTERWPGSRPLWPALLTGVTNLTMAWDNGNVSGEHAGWITQHDPVLRFVRELLAEGYADEAGVVTIDARIQERIREAREFALNSPVPDPNTVFDGVFA